MVIFIDQTVEELICNDLGIRLDKWELLLAFLVSLYHTGMVRFKVIVNCPDSWAVAAISQNEGEISVIRLYLVREPT